MDSRKEFLSKFWNRYPSVKVNAVDASAAFSFLNSDKTLFIGGRLEGAPGDWILSSGGASGTIRFEQTCKWADASTAFDASVFDVGDIVLLKARVSGTEAETLFRVSEVQLLAPSFTPANHNSAAQIKVMEKWSSFLQQLRSFFLQKSFMEAQTPTLVPAPGTEPYLDVFTTEFIYGQQRRTYFLPTSPEFHLKKLLARGHSRIFEIKNCFRNGEVSIHHQPEFQMLEWYRAYAGLDAIIDDIRELLNHLQKSFPDTKIGPLKVTTMAALFAEHCNGFVLTPDTSRQALYDLCMALALHPVHDDTWDDLFFRVVLEKIEPALDKSVPTIVQGYPKPQAALSRLSEEGWAQRFEFYWGGLEIANAFDELNDPKQNEERFKSDLEKREKSGRASHPIDTELVEIFYSGMPPAGGIALGVERLFMALFEISDISDIKPFAIKV